MEHEDTSANDERYVRVADVITFLKTFYAEEAMSQQYTSCLSAVSWSYTCL
jgi:hypothetical protein